MKTPPPADEHVIQRSPVEQGRDARFLALVGTVLVAVAFGFKSELVNPGETWDVGLLLLLVALPALLGYLRMSGRWPAVEHFVPAVLAAIAVTGLSVLVTEWWKYALMALAYGAFFAITARLDYRRLRQEEKPGHVVVQEAIQAVTLAAAYLVVVVATSLSLPLRLGWVFVITVLVTFRSFRVLGAALPSQRAFLFSILVGQVVTFFGWAMTVYVLVNEGTLAVMLLLAWYINRGVIRHTADDSLSRQIALEYGMFTVVLGALFFFTVTVRR